MEIKRDIGNGVFTWTDVVTGVTGYRTDLAKGSAVNVPFSEQEVAWKDGTLTLRHSSVNTSVGGSDVKIYVKDNSLWYSVGSTLYHVATTNG